MTTSTTGDADTIRRIKQAVRDHFGDTGAWARLGENLAIQRSMLSRAYGQNRSLFARERIYPTGIVRTAKAAEKLAYDIEGGIRWGRQSYPPDVLIAIADAYGVTLASVGAALDGGQLEPATPARPAPAPVPAPEPAAAAPPAVLLSGVLTDAAIEEAAPHAARIMMRLMDLGVVAAAVVDGRLGYRDAEGAGRPPGHEVFAAFTDATPDDIRNWDDNVDELPEIESVAWIVAAKRVAGDWTRLRDTSARLAAM